MHKYFSSLLWILWASFLIPTGAFASRDDIEEIRRLEQLSVIELEKAANAGNPNARLLLGYEYFTGRRLERDYKKALDNYLESAKSGSHNAMSNLCNMYLHGYGVEKDYVVAFQWCKEPARAGNTNAMVMLAEIALAKEGPFRDRTESFRNEMAFQFYEMAAIRDHAHGQYMLGRCYENGVGVKKTFNRHSFGMANQPSRDTSQR